MVADVLMEIADVLETSKDPRADAQKVLKKITTDHARIVFNGDNYSDEWVKEAQKRGLPNIRSTVEAIETILDKENVDLFCRQGVLSAHELHARSEILLDNYSKTLNIEANVMLSIAKRDILPACIRYCGQVASTINGMMTAGLTPTVLQRELEKVNSITEDLSSAIAVLEKAAGKAKQIEKAMTKARIFRDEVIPAMAELRKVADTLETIVDAALWPLPGYAQMLFLR
jgi:glutamine synthetase